MSSDAKTDFLRKEGIINPKPERVVHDLFQSHEFFDPLDLPQVRYEMLRIARVEKAAVIEACRLFGFSREYFYRLERDFMSHGYAGLLGSFKGRRPLIAMNQEIVNFIVHRKMADPNITGENLRKELAAAYQMECSKRTVERVVEKLRLGKRGARTISS
jgi:transposase